MKKVAKTMSVGFTNEDFYEAYKKYYPYMMVEARKMCDDYKRLNNSRKKKGYKNIVFFPEPEEFLKQASSKTIGLTRKAHQGGDVMSTEELARYTLMLEQDSKSRIAERKRKEEAFLMLAQDVEPKYIKKLIDMYFRTRRTNTLDVNSRYLILLEIAQFKCKESITFLSKINSCDKNNDMRLLHSIFFSRWVSIHGWQETGRKRNDSLRYCL